MLVADHAVVLLEARARGQLDGRRDADGQQHRIALDGLALGQHDPHARLDRLDARAGDQLDPVPAMEVGEEVAELAAEDALERRAAHLAAA